MKHAEGVDRFVAALLSSDRVAALEIAHATVAEHGLGRLVDEIVRPAMKQIGSLWAENRISVAHEHMATALAQSVVAMIYPEIEWPRAAQTATAIVTCAEKEQHCFGSQLVADVLALDGWDARYLGGDVPTPAVVEMAKSIHPVLVAISVTLPTHIRQTQELIEALATLRPRPRILVGGTAVDAGFTAKDLGADAAAGSARDALRIARSWKP